MTKFSEPLQRFTMGKGWYGMWKRTMYVWKREWIQSLMPRAEVIRVYQENEDSLTVYWRHRNET